MSIMTMKISKAHKVWRQLKTENEVISRIYRGFVLDKRIVIYDNILECSYSQHRETIAFFCATARYFERNTINRNI